MATPLDFEDPFSKTTSDSASPATKLDFKDPFARRPTASVAPAGERVAKRPERTWGEAAGDTALGVAKGAWNIIGGLMESRASMRPDNLARQGARVLDKLGVPGAQELAKRIPRTPTEAVLGQAAGSENAALSAGVQMAGDWLDRQQSDALQQEKQELAQTEGFLGSAKKVLTSPQLLANFVAEQVPNIATVGAGTRLAAARAGQRALAGAVARGLGTEAAEAAATTAGRTAATRAATGITTAMETGSAGQQTYQQAMAQPQDVWDANPEYQRMVAAGQDPVTAKETIARGASMQAQAITAPIAAVAGRFAAPFEADVFTRGLARKPVAMLKGAAKETVEETIQEGGSQFAGNVGQQQIDPNQSAWEGVPEAAGTGAALGAVLGGGMAAGGAIASRPQAEGGSQPPIARRPEPTAATPPDLPPAPLALPPSDGTPAYGINVVTPGGTVLTPEQRGLDPRVTGEPAPPAPNPAAVPGVRVSDDSLNQQAPRTAAPAIPYPDAAPGSLADVANVAATAQRGAQAPPAEPAPVQAPAAPTIPPPWVDPETGESLRAPTSADIEQLLHANLNYQLQSGSGISTPATLKVMRDQYGLGSAIVRPALEKVKAERKRGITAAQTPSTPLQDDLLSSGAPASSVDDRLREQVRENTAARRASIDALQNTSGANDAPEGDAPAARDSGATDSTATTPQQELGNAKTSRPDVSESTEEVQARVRQLSRDETAVQQPEISGLPTVWGEGDQGLRSLEREGWVPELPGGHGMQTGNGDVLGSDRSGRELRAGELPLGDGPATGEQPPLLPSHRGERAEDDHSGSSRALNLPPMTLRKRLLKQRLPLELAVTPRRLPFRKDSKFLTYQGMTLAVPEWAALLGIRLRTLRERLRKGMPLDRALSSDGAK